MKSHDLPGLQRALARQTMTRKGNPAFASTRFTRLSSFNHGGLFVGRFAGRAPWERHRHGDVPRGLWHRQHARTEVTLLSATPTPTDVSFTDPRPRRVGSAQREMTAARKRTTSRRLRSRTTGNGVRSG